MSESPRLVPVSFSDACAFVAAHHRHHPPPPFHQFCIGAAVADTLVGVAIISRPSARLLADGMTLEVVRTATDGTDNVNSLLYGAAWRAAKALGYRRLVTYTQASESGASLRAAGWTVVAELPPRNGWNVPSRPRRDYGLAYTARTRWERRLEGDAARPEFHDDDTEQETLW